MGTTRPGEPWALLRVLRERSGFSQRALARAAGLSPGYICDLEWGRHSPSPAVTAKLATALGVPYPVLDRRTDRAPNGEDAA